MIEDHGYPSPPWSELWSLREDVEVLVEPDGQPVRLRNRWGEISIQQPSPVVREALRRMLLGPISLENVIGARGQPGTGETAAASLAALRQVLDRLQPFIIRTLGIMSGRPLLSVVPLTPGAGFRPVPLLADTQIRLSAFVQLRTDGHEYRLESPLALHRVLLHRPEALWLLSSLNRPVTGAEAISAISSARAWPHLDTVAAAALAYLAATGMLATVGEPDEPSVADHAELAAWSVTDLAFHTYSNGGRHDSSLGRTYPFGQQGSAEPFAKPPQPEPGIMLHRPDWNTLATADPPLAVVMEGRRSTRQYGAGPVTAEELGDLLYRTARIRSVITPPGTADTVDTAGRDPRLSDRPYPGGGACYELELYLTVGNCAGVPRGIYHYDPFGHRLEPVNAAPRAVDDLLRYASMAAAVESPAPVLVTMTARLRRLSWKYEGIVYATVLKDVGVMLQNMYLVCTAMGLAPCALGAVNLEATSRAFGTDWLLEPSVGQFILGRAPAAPPEHEWPTAAVNDAQWAEAARKMLGGC